jgi:hypothetical protein
MVYLPVSRSRSACGGQHHASFAIQEHHKKRQSYLGNAEYGVALGVNSVLAVQLDGGGVVASHCPAFPDPLDVRSRLTAEPKVVADGASPLQGYVVNAIANQVRRD